MQVTVLGSAAAEGWPGLFCECPQCGEARRRGGPNIRRRTAYRINTDTLVDFGPDIYWQSVAFGIDLAQIRHLFVTHSHADHLAPTELSYRRRGYSRVTRPLTIYGNEQVFARLERELPVPLAELQAERVVLAPGATVQAGSLRVTALKAQHA